jgi:cobalt-zinc-cadmium efflux system membrane fusion protein
MPLVLLALAVLMVPAIVAYRYFTHPAAESETRTPDAAGTVALGASAQKDAGFAIGEVRRLSRTERLEAPGILAIDEKRTVRIGSPVEGKVISVKVEVGDRVPAKMVLAELHSPVIHDAWADYRKAIAERRRRVTEAAFALQSVERATRLYDAKAISLQEKRRAEVERVAADEELDRIRTEVRRAEEALGHLGVTNSEDPSGESGELIPVVSPLGGVVLEKHVTAGSAVTTGVPLFTVSDLSELWAIAEIDETRLPLVKVGLAAEVRVAAYPDQVFEGKVTFVGDTINPKTRRVAVRCQVPNPKGLLKPEMFASLSVAEGAARTVLAVPATAIQEMDGKNVVFVASADGKFARREVETGSEAEGWIEIRGGLVVGEKVATAGSFLLKSELLKASQPAGD